MSPKNIQINMDDELFARAEMICKAGGIDMSTAVSIFLTGCVKAGELPFGHEAILQHAHEHDKKNAAEEEDAMPDMSELNDALSDLPVGEDVPATLFVCGTNKHIYERLEQYREEMYDKNNKLRLRYYDYNGFYNAFCAAVRINDLPGFITRLKNTDLLILAELDRLFGRPDLSGIVSDIISGVIEHKKTAILTADRIPLAIRTMPGHIRALISGGDAVDMR